MESTKTTQTLANKLRQISDEANNQILDQAYLYIVDALTARAKKGYYDMPVSKDNPIYEEIMRKLNCDHWSEDDFDEVIERLEKEGLDYIDEQLFW